MTGLFDEVVKQLIEALACNLHSLSHLAVGNRFIFPIALLQKATVLYRE